jgi:signal peptidase II
LRELDLNMIGRIGMRLLLTFAVLGTVGCDQVTKHVAKSMLADSPGRSYLADTIRFEYAENAGGFLSLGATWPPAVRTGLLTAATGALLLVLAAVAFRSDLSDWSLLGLTLFISGGASNWVDRARSGVVVDFMNVGVGAVRTGIFNAADVAILCGVALCVFAETRRGILRHPRA